MVVRKNNIEQQGTLRQNWVYEHTMYRVIDFFFWRAETYICQLILRWEPLTAQSNNSSNVKFGGPMALSIGLTNKSVDEGSQEPGITQKHWNIRKPTLAWLMTSENATVELSRQPTSRSTVWMSMAGKSLHSQQLFTPIYIAG